MPMTLDTSLQGQLQRLERLRDQSKQLERASSEQAWTLIRTGKRNGSLFQAGLILLHDAEQ